MIVDARSLPNGAALDADICIVGAGAAGLTIARSMIGTPWKVALLESGGFDVDGRTQMLYAGANVGLPYERLSTARSRYFGGSTNCWGGFCRPFDPIDLEARPWVPHSGWPFGIEELTPYYDRAHAVLGLGHTAYTHPYWEQHLRPEGIGLLPVDDDDVENRIAQICRQPRMSISSDRLIKDAANVTCYLNANVLEFQTNDVAAVVQRVQCATLSGTRFSVDARLFVLCCGGIENARLLLLSNKVQSAGLGNEHDLVGRYFTDHPRIKSTAIRLSDQKHHRRLYDMTLALSRRRMNIAHLPITAAMSPTSAAQRKLGLVNSRTYLVAQYHGEASDGFRALHDVRMLLSNRRKFGTTDGNTAAVLREALPRIATHLPNLAYALFDNLANPEWVARTFVLETIMEPLPNPDSRVTLGTERDELGLNQSHVDWRLTAQDRENYLRTHDLIHSALARRGLIVPAASPVDAADAWPERIAWCWHHMGTTRMHEDPKQGVVDARCRVHGIHNLYIGGSSTFPTMGSDHPTINLVALALRLSDELAARMAQDSVSIDTEKQQAA
ncbi:GMC oxidoreductase [Azospirillum sp. sgz301742]